VLSERTQEVLGSLTTCTWWCVQGSGGGVCGAERAGTDVVCFVARSHRFAAIIEEQLKREARFSSI